MYVCVTVAVAVAVHLGTMVMIDTRSREIENTDSVMALFTSPRVMTATHIYYNISQQLSTLQ
jgi:hypothetical protein